MHAALVGRMHTGYLRCSSGAASQTGSTSVNLPEVDGSVGDTEGITEGIPYVRNERGVEGDRLCSYTEGPPHHWRLVLSMGTS